jgi:predicted PhzF superfamily epimerase YddE/YHI9
MPTLHVVRVFTDEEGKWGNPLGVFLDGAAVPEERRQQVAADLGFSETVYVDHAAEARLRIFTPNAELPLAGHPLVGTSWLLAQQGHAPTTLRPPAGDCDTWSEGAVTWIRARPEWAPDWEFVEVDDPRVVAGLRGPTRPEHDHTVYWAWVDADGGIVRARVFASRFGVAEDEATGSAALLFARLLGRPVEIWQGNGSLLYARQGPDGSSEAGGRVVLDEVRDYILS